MAKPDILVIDGHGHSWQRICELRRHQLEAWRAAEARQLALFEMKDDSRPSAERSAAKRYEEPTLFSFADDSSLGDSEACDRLADW